MMIGTAVLQIVNSLHLHMKMQYSQSAVVNINTQTHDPDLDDEEQINEQQNTDDIFNVKGKKAVIEITPMMMKKLTMIFRKSKQHLIVSKN